MPKSAKRKQPKRYHHGDLQRALLQKALQIIRQDGVDALTLRGLGKAIGVSQTAIYRHFADKSTLLRTVAREGFHTLSSDLMTAWDTNHEDPHALALLGEVYVQFALKYPSYYRVMFAASFTGDADLSAEANAAFQILMDCLNGQQPAGQVLEGDMPEVAAFIWSTLHGIAMLAIDDRLSHRRVDIPSLIRFSMRRVNR